MKYVFVLLFLIYPIFGAISQEKQMSFTKGRIIDSIQVNDSIPENYNLYIPKKFNGVGQWPVLVVFSMEAQGRQVLSIFRQAAEEHGFILVSSNNVSDSLSISKNVLITSRMLRSISNMLPLDKNRVYTGGFGSGAKFASLVPSFIKQIRGVISIGSPVANVELLNTKNPFYFVGIVGNEDYNYPDMLSTKLVLGKLKFPNNLIVYDGGAKDYDSEAINQAIEILIFSSMAKGIIPRKEDFIVDSYHRGLAEYSALMNTGNQYKAQYELSQLISIYQPLIEIDSLQDEVKNVKKQKTYKIQKRSFNNILFQESLIREEFEFNLNEDINSLNYNNLGWWNYQMGELKKYDAKPDPLEVQMGKRLLSYLNALIEDYIDMEKSQQMVNDEVLSYLWMLKTITEPSNYKYYLNIISDSAKYEDYGTALFYLEELLKQGYTDKEELYSLDNTALLRIMPEFNLLVNEYLKSSRYDRIIE